MTPRREPLLFCAVLAGLVAGFLGESLFGGKVLSPADVLWVSASFREVAGPRYEPANRLLMDPVLQFEPWLEFSRASLRRGRLPLWNDLAGCGAPFLANGQSAVFDPFHAIAYIGRLPGGARLDGRGAALDGRAGDVPARPIVGLRGVGPLVRGPRLPLLRLPGRLAPLPGHQRGGLAPLALPGERPGPRVSRPPVDRRAGARGGDGPAGGSHPDRRPHAAGRGALRGVACVGPPR